MSNYYGYDLDIRATASVDLGAIMYDMLMCYHYCKTNDLVMVFIEEGYDAEWFGEMSYHDIFQPCDALTNKTVPMADVVEMWPSCSKGFDTESASIEYFGKLARELFSFQPSVVEGMDDDIDVALCVHNKDIPLKIYLKEIPEGSSVCVTSSVVPKRLQDVRVMKNDDKYVEQVHRLKAMTKANLLIGGRVSYMFRMAELLRHPLPSVNLKDSDEYGVAEYSREPFVRPLRPRAIKNFINPSCTQVVIKDGFALIPDFVNPKLSEMLESEVDDHEWWSRVVHPDEDGQTPGSFATRSHKCKRLERTARSLHKQERFTYMFWKSVVSGHGSHYNTCVCIFCRLYETFNSFEVLDYLSTLVGKKVISFGETFGSKYEIGDYLGVHHDKDKGDYAFVLELSKDWKEEYGGITLLLARDQREIIREVIPSFGSLTIFEITDTAYREVTEIKSNKERVSFTGWFNVEK